MPTIRPLTLQDIPRLVEIRPGFSSSTSLKVEPVGNPPFVTWQLVEVSLPTPFDKGSGYDFNAQERRHIQQRAAQDDTLLEVVEGDGRLLGILDVEERAWNHSAWVWNIMLDHSIRRQGLGRTLIEHALAWSRQRGLRALMLETQTNNVPACRFYASLGFQLVGLNTVFYSNEDVREGEVALFWAYLL